MVQNLVTFGCLINTTYVRTKTLSCQLLSALWFGEFGLGLLFHTAPSCSAWSSLCLSLAIVALSIE